MEQENKEDKREKRLKRLNWKRFLSGGIIAEFIGTFCIVFFGGWAYLQNERSKQDFNWTAVALTQGLFVAFSVWGFEKVSGGHFNWAVTMTLSALGKLPAGIGAWYLLAQTLGSVAASALIDILTPTSIDMSTTTKTGFPRLQEPYTEVTGFFCEFISGAIYMYIVMAFNYDKRIPKGLYGLGAGGAAMTIIMSTGPITGGAANPARIVGPILISLMTYNKNMFNDMHNYWFFFLGPILGALIAGCYYEFFVNLDDDEIEAEEDSMEELPGEEVSQEDIRGTQAIDDSQVPEADLNI